MFGVAARGANLGVATLGLLSVGARPSVLGGGRVGKGGAVAAVLLGATLARRTIHAAVNLMVDV